MGTVFNYSFWSKMKRHISSSVVLIFFTILALICANIQGVKDWYFALWQNPVSFSVGEFNLFSHGRHALTLGQVINDFLMAIFFLSVGLEIKREIRVGELSTRDKARPCRGLKVFSIFVERNTANKIGVSQSFGAKLEPNQKNRPPRYLEGRLWCLGRESNPYGHCCPRDFKSRVSTYSTTKAIRLQR